MTKWWRHHEWARNCAGYALTASLAVALLIGCMQLWDADLTVPFDYQGDGTFTGVLARTVMDHGWYLNNPRLGMPFGAEMYDFPLAESLHFAVFKLFGACGCDYALTVNLYFLLTFPLTALTTYFVLRHFGSGRLAALVASQLFTFLPYHFWRYTAHLFLAAYYLVPLMVMLILWVYREPGLLFTRQDGTERLRFTPFSWRVLAGVAIVLLMASAGVYYAFFGCFFLFVAGLCRAGVVRRFQPLWSAAFFSGVMIAGGLINLAPNLIYTYQHGGNDKVAHRYPYEAEMFSLRLTQLVLPVPGHRLRPLRELRQLYDLGQVVPYCEGNAASLGIICSTGFLLLLARLFYHRPLTDAPELEEGLVALNGSGLLLATLGGLGSLFAVVVSPAIRAYGRMSIYLGFFGLFAIVLLIEKLDQRYGGSIWGRSALRLALLLLLVFGLIDQAPLGFFGINRSRKIVQQEYRNDAAFVQAIEARLPAGAMVFQLPYYPFPETYPDPGKMAPYDHFGVYLLSDSLRWSWGAMRGRPADLWQAKVSAMPLKEMVTTLVDAGFSGIYIDRFGYDDGAEKLEANLRGLLQSPALKSADDRKLLFDLTAYSDARRAERSAAELKRSREHALLLPLIECQ